MATENHNVTITPEILVKVLVKRCWLLLIVGILSFGIMFLYSNITFVPQYESMGRLYVLRQPGENDSQQNADYQVSLLVVADCTHILKDHIVIDKVIDELDLDMTYEQLSRNIQVENPTDTRVLYVTVKAGDAVKAKSIVDSLCANGAAVINDLMGEDQIKFYGEGEVSKNPANNPSGLVMAALSLGLMLAVYVLLVIIFAKSEHVGSGEGLESRLGVAVLGDIPDANRRARGRLAYKRYSKYGQYAYGAVGAKKGTDAKETKTK